ncbi:S9 family peptidase, partial [Pseudomonas gingeri]|nr:S9 family peptidase [Pseudomonas gingeri]
MEKLCETSPDPYQWLEDVDGTGSLDWVQAQNLKTEDRLARTDSFLHLKAEVLQILDSDSNIPHVDKVGAYYYNFWMDA